MSINFIGRVSKAIASTMDCAKCAKINLPEGKDVVSISDSAKKMQEALKEAYEYCIESVSKENPKERCVAIDELGNILYKSEGQEKSCSMVAQLLQPNSTIIHSHPGEKLIPLSTADIISFITTPEAKKIVAVSQDGGTCYMKKPEGFAQYFFNDREMIRKAVEGKFESDWLSHFNINPKVDENYVRFYEEKLMQKAGVSSIDELYEKIIGCTKPKNIEDRVGMLKYACENRYFFPMFEPTRHNFMQLLPEIGKISDTDEGIKIQKAFNESIAQRFGLEYQYNA